ncbi:MAG: hypothetical protein NTW94_10010 [Legionellales bacterium]|nr:hypothetical protein [Legionellales bacterium]
MTNRLELVNHLSSEKQHIKLHPDVLTILFEHRRYIKSVFLDLAGLHEIAHLGITIVDPAKEILVFSSTPNIEYNLIQQHLWRADPCFSPRLHTNNNFCWWNSCHADEIEKIKFKNNQFNFGMTLARKINNFHLLYSYATRSRREDLPEYYESNLHELIVIGDYFYKSIRDIYSSYGIKYPPPELDHLRTKASQTNIRPYLRLVVATNRG